MLLAIDVGNTHIVIGVYRQGRLDRHWRLSTDPGRTAEEYGALLWTLSQRSGLPRREIDGAVVASVVPALNEVLKEVCRSHFGQAPLFVGPGVRTGMPILYENPKEVGADRICNAVAAYDRYRGAVIVVDFGTATTFDYVTGAGEYAGGVIVPGIGISLEALFTRTAKLTRVELVKPPAVVGRTTVHAIQAGVVYGTAALVDGVVARIRREQGAGARVIATGGFAGLVAPVAASIEATDEFLTLEGLRLIFERNR